MIICAFKLSADEIYEIIHGFGLEDGTDKKKQEMLKNNNITFQSFSHGL